MRTPSWGGKDEGDAGKKAKRMRRMKVIRVQPVNSPQLPPFRVCTPRVVKSGLPQKRNKPASGEQRRTRQRTGNGRDNGDDDGVSGDDEDNEDDIGSENEGDSPMASLAEHRANNKRRGANPKQGTLLQNAPNDDVQSGGQWKTLMGPDRSREMMRAKLMVHSPARMDWHHRRAAPWGICFSQVRGIRRTVLEGLQFLDNRFCGPRPPTTSSDLQGLLDPPSTPHILTLGKARTAAI